MAEDRPARGLGPGAVAAGLLALAAVLGASVAQHRDTAGGDGADRAGPSVAAAGTWIEPLPDGWRLEGRDGGGVRWDGEVGTVADGEVWLMAPGAAGEPIERLAPGTAVVRSAAIPRLLFRAPGSEPRLWQYHYWGRLGRASGWSLRDEGGWASGSGVPDPAVARGGPWPLPPVGALGP